MDNRAMIQRSLDYIEDNLQSEITASELSEAAGYSLYHYYRLFQQATGLPVMQYILRRKLLYGAYAISQGSTKIDAAFQYGFDTYAGFYKAFCREFGCSPSKYLKSGRAKQPYRINLMQEEHMTISRRKAALILQNWNMSDATITDIYYERTGNKNESAMYVGDKFILKFTTNLGKLKKHIEVSKALAGIGLLSAVPVLTNHGEEYIQDGELYFYLTRRLPGEQMVSQNFSDGDGRFVGEIIGQLHLALSEIDDCVNERDLLRNVKEWALPRARSVLNLSDEFCKEYLDAFAELYPKLPRQIIHRDPNPGNIICTGDQWGFIDFELAERNARIFDPCYAATAVLSETFGQNNERWLEIFRDIIYGYESVVHMTKEEHEAVPYVVLANQFICVAWFAEQDKYAEIFETNKHMTLWLIDTFEKLKDI